MAHQNYYLDLCVDTFIVNGDSVLLRLHEKYNLWSAPGGHIDPGEDVNEAALREVWEEAGMKVELVGPRGWEKKNEKTNIDLVPPIFMNRHSITDTHDHSALIFAAKSDTRKVEPQTEEDKVATFKWCTQSELDELLKTDSRMRPEIHRYASTALQLVSTSVS